MQSLTDNNILEYRQLRRDQIVNVRHHAVRPPRAQNPFLVNTDHHTFIQELDRVIAAQDIPAGLGVRPEEWEEDGYPQVETLARRGRGSRITVELPQEIWGPRAVVWAQALFLMTRYRLDKGLLEDDWEDDD